MLSDIFIFREKYKGSLEFNFDFVCVDKLGKNLKCPAAIVLGGRQKSDTFYIMRGNIEYDL